MRDFAGPEEVAEAEARLNAYPGLERLRPPESVRVLEEISGLEELGRRAVLDGRILWEHAAAGEATRLGLGSKFSLLPADLARVGAELLAGSDCGVPLPVSLGLRRLLQSVYEIRRLADESGLDRALVMARQTVLLIVGEDNFETAGIDAIKILSRLLPLKNLWLMGQKAYHGLHRPEDGPWAPDPSSPKRLHNHGQMAMQKAMEGQIARLDASGGLSFFSRKDLSAILDEFEDLASFNIEDLDFLGRAIDLETAGLAARLGRSGYDMVMEITPNNPKRPVKGGMCAFDPALGRDVMIESFRLIDVAPKDILFLNKNFNHYPRPGRILAKLREAGLFMPVKVMDGRVHFQPVQGDLNFLARPAFFTRKEGRALNALKTPADIPAALEAMRRQDAQKGFKDLVEEALRL